MGFFDFLKNIGKDVRKGAEDLYEGTVGQIVNQIKADERSPTGIDLTGQTGGQPNPLVPPPNRPPPPIVPKYQPPPFYSPRQSQLQRSTYNPSSTSHNYLERFGAASHI